MEFCLICFEKLNYKGIVSRLIKPCICHKCFLNMNRDVKKGYIDDIPYTSLYPYKDQIVSLIYQFKGCNDKALAPVFLSYDSWFLKMIYKNYILVTIPSYEEHDSERGFNHVVEMFSSLGLKRIDLFKKTKPFKQSSLNRIEREKAVQYLILQNSRLLTNQSILLVDDIITTGSTLKRAVALLKTLCPKRIKILTIAYGVSKN